MNKGIVDCSKIHDNVKSVKEFLPPACKVLAVVKGDAYGHGANCVAKALDHMDEIFMLGVAALREAYLLWKKGIQKRILILCQVFPEEIKSVLEEIEDEEDKKRLIRQMVFSAYSGEEVRQFGSLSTEFGEKFSVHLRLDFFGGVRGLDRESYEREGESLLLAEDVNVCGLYAHLYSAYLENEERAKYELGEYAKLFRGLPEQIRQNLLCHMLTSVSFFRFPEYTFDMVRIGAALYGLPLRDENQWAPKLKEVMTIYGTVMNVVPVVQKSTLDYVGAIPDNIKKVALVSVGSWDLPNFFVGSNISVRINDHLLSVVGSPTMDSCCVDVTNVSDVKAGDKVYFLGDPQGIRLENKLWENGFTYNDCQMIFSGLGRLKRVCING